MKKYRLLEEPELVSLLVQGDRNAFDALHYNLAGWVAKYALRICKDSDATADIVQNVMVKIWKNREHIDTARNFRGWVAKITAREVFDYLKTVSKDRALKELVKHSLDGQPGYTEDEYLLKEYLSLLDNRIKSLPFQQQKVFRLSREEDHTYDEIAGILKISSHTVRNHMAGALANLRKQIGSIYSAMPGILIGIQVLIKYY